MWMRRSGDNGNVDAQFNMGTVYQNGMGVDKDPKAAAAWFQKAAEAGDSGALMQLSRAYAGGNGVPEDPVRAYMLLDVLQTVDPEAEDLAAERVKRVTFLNPAQIEQAKTLAQRVVSRDIGLEAALR